MFKHITAEFKKFTRFSSPRPSKAPSCPLSQGAPVSLRTVLAAGNGNIWSPRFELSIRVGFPEYRRRRPVIVTHAPTSPVRVRPGEANVSGAKAAPSCRDVLETDFRRNSSSGGVLFGIGITFRALPIRVVPNESKVGRPGGAAKAVCVGHRYFPRKPSLPGKREIERSAPSSSRSLVPGFLGFRTGTAVAQTETKARPSQRPFPEKKTYVYANRAEGRWEKGKRRKTRFPAL